MLVHAQSNVRFVVNKEAWQRIQPALSAPVPTASDDGDSDDDEEEDEQEEEEDEQQEKDVTHTV